MYSLSVPKENIPAKKQHIADDIKQLMDTYGNDVLRTSFMYLKDVQKAEDAFQEVFIKVYKKYEGFNGESSEKTWIIKITINVYNDILRSSWLKRVLVTDKTNTQSIGSDVESIVMEKDESKQLFDVVTSLKFVYKEIIILYYYQEFDTLEISKILNIAEGTVRSRLYRAREILKKKIGRRTDLRE